MKANKEFSILHFSDLHFGEFSIVRDEKRPSDFENYFFRFHSKVSDIIQKEAVDIVIISGDFCSKSLFYMKPKRLKKKETIELPPYLIKFLNIFKNQQIPILIAIGNHEINRRIKKHEERVEIFKKLKESVKDHLNSKFSEEFNRNFINYKLFRNHNIFAFSIDTTFSLRDKHWKDPSIDLGKLASFFDEIATSEGIECLNFKKILVSHFPMKEIHDFDDIKPYFLKQNIELILSGHYHKRGFEFICSAGRNKYILNLIAGSPFLNLEKRMKGQLWDPVNFQFNHYILSGSDWKQLTGSYYIYNDNKVWEKKNLINLFYHPLGFQNWLERIKYQTMNHPNELRIKMLKEKGNQTEEEEMGYVFWIFNGFINNYSFTLKFIQKICKNFNKHVQIFFNDEHNYGIIEKVLNQAETSEEEKSRIFLRNLKKGEKIWPGTIQEFQNFLVDIFQLNEETVLKIYHILFNDLKIEVSSEIITPISEEKIEIKKSIEKDEVVISTLEAINRLFTKQIKNPKINRKFKNEFGYNLTELNDILLDLASQTLANSLLDDEGVILFNWRKRLQKQLKNYTDTKLTDKIPEGSNLDDYIDTISDYTLILAKDNFEYVLTK